MYPLSVLAKSREPSGDHANPRKPALAPVSLTSVSGRPPLSSARKTLDLFSTAKNALVGCKARSLGRPLKAIDPPSIR